MGFLDNVFKPNKTTNKKNTPNNNNNTNPLANFGKSLQTNFTTVTGGGASKFTGPGQSLGGAQPGEVLDIILSEPGTLGIRIEKKSNNTASAIVAHVVPGSQAAIAGLQRGDVICCAGSQGQHEIQYDMFLEIAKSTQRPIYLEARRLTPTKSASSSAGAAAAAAGPTGRGGGGGSADAESRRKAMIAAAEAREKVHKQKLRPMNKKSAHKTTTTTQQDVNNFTSAELQPQTEAARIAMRAVKRDEQRLAQELGYNPYAAANSTAGQARTATATTQYGELNSGSGSGGISTTTGTSSATASTAIPVVAPPLDPTTSAVREEHPLPEEFEDAFVTIISQSDTAASKTGLKIARTLILNATTKGQQRTEEEEAAKFRKVRLDNPKIKQAIVEVPGNIQLLLSVGFQLVECENHNESLLVFPPQSTGPVWLPTALRRMEHQEQAL